MCTSHALARCVTLQVADGFGPAAVISDHVACEAAREFYRDIFSDTPRAAAGPSTGSSVAHTPPPTYPPPSVPLGIGAVNYVQQQFLQQQFVQALLQQNELLRAQNIILSDTLANVKMIQWVQKFKESKD